MRYLVRENLFIGNINAAADVLECKEGSSDITHILSVLSSASISFFTEWRSSISIPAKEIRQVFAEDVDSGHALSPGKLLYSLEYAGKELKVVRMTIPIKDTENQNLLDYLECCLNFIEESRKEGSVLVHCFAGVSRSAAIITAYLMRSERLPLEDALESLRQSCEFVSPNDNFLEQLKMFEEMGFKVDHSTTIYKRFRMKMLGDSYSRGERLDSSKFGADPGLPQEASSCKPGLCPNGTPKSSVAYRCKKCRRVVAAQENLVDHSPGEGLSAFQWQKRNGRNNFSKPDDFGCSSIFVEPLKWMKTVIPKVEAPETIMQFRPLGLCNVLYKLVTKTISNRLKLVLPHIIAPTQVSFVPKRHITDNVVIMHEALHTMRRKSGNKGTMAIKLDLEKAYDRLSWKFIRETLLEMRLPITMVEVIMICVTTPSMQVLWNGKATESFKPTRGIRQGDPLSPYIFVACMERLTHIIEAEVGRGAWKPFRLSRGGPKLSQLFFADDVVLFAEASQGQANIISNCLHRFCEASGQKISSSKSRVYFSPNTRDSEKITICNSLGIDATDDLGLYLGVPTITSRVTKATFRYITERVEKRLSGWSSNCLRLAGRITLIRSTITAIPAYAMQSMQLPRSVCDDIDKMTRKFLWGGSTDERKVSLLSWEKVTMAKSEGGLGLRPMRELNQASMCKLGFNMLARPKELWANILRFKYCKGSRFIEDIKPKTYQSLVWKGIANARPLMAAGTRSAIGNGLDTRFWYDRWALPTPLIELATNPIPPEELSWKVADVWTHGAGWELEKFAGNLPSAALERIAGVEVLADPTTHDRIFWGESDSSTCSLNSVLRLARRTSNDDNSKIWNLIWKIRAPQKFRVLLWLICHDRLMTNANRKWRKMTLLADCEICGHMIEDIDHIFRECKIATEIWQIFGDATKLGNTFGIMEWVFLNLSNHPNDAHWPTKFCTILWWIWRWRNMACFGNLDQIPEDRTKFLRNQMDVTIRALNRDSISNPVNIRPRREVHVRWNPPLEGWCMLNTDGAIKGTLNRAGGGGVFRNSSANWLFGFSEKYGACSILTAELRAIFRGVRLARMKGITHLWIQADSKTAIEALRGHTEVFGDNSILVSQIINMTSLVNWSVRFSHCYRESNKVADMLSKKGSNLGLDFYFYESPPSEVLGLLDSDRVGASWPRLVVA